MIDEQVRDVVQTSEKRIERSGVRSADDVRRGARPLVAYSPERRRFNLELRKYLYRNLYYNPAVHLPNQRAVRMLDQLFHHYCDHPDELGERTRRRIRGDGLRRAVCDYLAGMTDRFAI